MTIDLISRLKAATGPSRELEAEIALANGWTKNTFPYCENYWKSPSGQICPQPPRYTESLDAAVTLVPQEMHYALCGPNDAAAVIETKPDYIGDYLHGPGTSFGATPAIALVIAILRAREALRQDSSEAVK